MRSTTNKKNTIGLVNFSNYYITIALILTSLLMVFHTLRSFTIVIHLLLLFFNILAVNYFSRNLSLSKFQWGSSIAIVFLAVFFALFLPDNFGWGSLIELSFLVSTLLVVPSLTISKSRIKKLKLYFVFFFIIYAFFIDKESYNTNNVSFGLIFLGAIVSFSFDLKKKWNLIFFLLFAIFVFNLIVVYRSKMGMGAWIIFCLMRFFPLSLLKKKFVVIMAMISLTFGSLVFAKVYVYLYDNNLVEVTEIELGDDQQAKRIFTGREVIWKMAFEELEEHPITGFGSGRFTKEFEGLGMHNSMVEIFGVFGVIVGLLFVALLFSIVMKVSPQLNTEYEKTYLVLFFTFLLSGFSETNLMHNTFVIMLPLSLLNSSINLRSKGVYL